MALAKRIAYNVVFNSVAKVFATVLALVAIGMITRYLGKDGFGDYAVMLAFFAFFNAVGDLGLGTVMTREISRKDADERVIAGSVFALRLTVSLAILAVSPVIILLLPYPSEVRFSILIAAVAFVFSSASMTLNGIFQKYLVMDRVSMVELAGKVIQVGVIAAGVYFDLGFLVICSSLLAYMAFNFFLVYRLSHRYVPFTLHFDRVFWKRFFFEALPVGIAAFIGFAYFKTDTILLSFFRSSAEVGTYNAAYKVMENLTFFPAMVSGLVFPLFSHYIFADREKFEIIANKTFKVFVVLITPLVIGGLFLAEPIMRLIGGAEFTDSAPVLRIFLVALAGIFFGNFFNNLLLAGNQQTRLMKALAGVAVFNISLNLFLIPRYAYFGAAWTSLATELLVPIIGGFLVARHLKYVPTPARIGRIAFSGALMGVFLWLFPTLSFPVAVIGGALVYLAGLVVTRAIEQDEITSLFTSDKGDVSKELSDELIAG